METPSTRRDFMNHAASSAAIAAGLCFAATAESQVAVDPIIRVGIIGLDTSHVSVFTKLLNGNANQIPELAKIRIVAAFPAGNQAFPLSKNRLAGFTKEVQDLGVKIVSSLDELLPLVDAVLLESVDGTQHLDQARPVFEAGKPLFIDKPLAASLRDVLAIAALGAKHNVPWFTASSSRFTAGYPELKQSEQVGDIVGCDIHSQSRAALGHPDLFWYGMHGVDLLYSLMGIGCETVSAVQTPYTEFVTGVWKNGRVGTYRAIREHTSKTGLGATVFGSKGIVHVNKYYDYVPLLVSIANFFRTRKSPIPVDEMVEVFGYLAAAEESKRRKGSPVSLAEVMQDAR